MTEQLKSLSFGEPRPASVADLEAELSALWRSMSEDTRAEHPVTRACALTLFVYTEDPEAQNEIAQAVARVTPQNPCRALVLIAEPAAKDSSLDAWVSAHCYLPVAGEKQVCCEQVSLHARGDAVRNLDNVVLPLTVAGLPVILWWRAAKFAPADYFEHILRVTDRVVVDSARFENPRPDLAALAGEVKKREGSLTISDLNWARGVGWREAMAQCFDPAESRPLLERIREVEILCAGPHGMAQALLLGAWLATRLGWKAKRATEVAGETQLRFETPGDEVKVQVVAGKRAEAGAAGISRILIRMDSDTVKEFHLVAGPSGACVRLRPEGRGEHAAERSVVMPPAEEGELLNRQLQRAGRDRVFEEALAVIAKL